MNKKILIAIALVFILSLLGVWGYFLVYGTPESVEDVFASFGSSSEQVDVMAPEPDQTGDTETTQIQDDDQASVSETSTTDSQPVRQITTEPVAGFTIYRPNPNATSTQNKVLFAERGTGHIYEYNLDTNDRIRRSNFTVQQAREAFISNDGSYAVIVRNVGSEREFHIFDLQNDDPNPTTISKNAQNIQLLNNNALVYTINSNQGNRALAYNLSTGVEQEIFRIPFTQARVAWGPTVNATHFVYTRPAQDLISHVYRVSGGVLRHTQISGYSLSIITNGTDVAYSYLEESGNLQSSVSLANSTNLNSPRPLTTTVVPEKCAFGSNNILFCADSQITSSINLTDWYIGLSQLSDSLWAVNLNLGSARQITNFRNQNGRSVDVDKIDVQEDVIALRNKTDGTLWIVRN